MEKTNEIISIPRKGSLQIYEKNKLKNVIVKKCVCCEVLVSENAGHKLYHSYGGSLKFSLACSDECLKIALDMPIKWHTDKRHSNWLKRCL